MLCTLAVLAAPLCADELRRVPFYRFGISTDGIGYTSLVLTDLTGDTRPEIISCSFGTPLAIGYSAGTYAPVWRGPAVNCAGTATGDADGDGATDIIVVNGTSSYEGSSFNGGSVMIFDPRGFGGPRLKVAIPGNRPANGVAYGNVDFDAAPEIVVVTDQATHVFDARTLALQWTADGYGGTEVAIADIDGDTRLEIVANDGTFGAILDGGNETLKWGYAGGFGQNLTVGNVDGDAKSEIVFAEGQWTYENLVILNGDFSATRFPYTHLPIGIGDANGDGVNEVILDAYYNGVAGMNPANGTVLWTMASPESGVFDEAVAGDVDGDGRAELVFGAGTDSGPDRLFVVDVVTKIIEHQSLDLDGELHSATGDVDGDGRPDLVVASHTSDGAPDSGIVQIIDPRTGTIKSVLSPPNSTFWISKIAIGQLDDDPAREIVAVGTDFYDPIIVVWDAATRQVQWQSAEPPWQSPTFNTTDVAVANIDGDAVDEIVIGMSDGNLVVLNGASPVIQASKNLGGYFMAIELVDVDDDGNLEAIVGTSAKLYLLDTAGWSIIKETTLPGIRSLAATAANGGRIAVTFEESHLEKVRLYDLQLTAFWTCAFGDDYFNQAPLVFADAGGETHLIGGRGTGALQVYPIAGGASCPTASSIEISELRIVDLHSADVTGDGWPELVVDTYPSVEAHLIGLSTELRGDADGDGSIGPQDVDELTDTLFGVTHGILPTADVNAVERISPEDLFALIHYEYAGGPEPHP